MQKGRCRLKIAFLVAHLTSGGAERTVAYLSSYLADKSWDVSIVSLTDDIFYTLNPKVQLKTLGIKSGYSNVIERYLLIFRRYYELAKYLRKNRPDVVFCMLPNMAKYILYIHKILKFKLITSERINPESCIDLNTIKMKNRVYLQSDGIVFQTKRARDYYSPEISKKGIVIHNAVGNELVYNVPDNIERKNKISAIGRLVDQKDYPTLLKSFKNVVEKYPEFTLEIFGHGPDRKALKLLADDLGIGEKVVFKGACSDAILQAADSACYVMSSLFEGMPNALMEAMAAGIPCVSTDCPNGPNELITDGVNGLLVPLSDVEALTSAILRMIEDKEFAEKCGKNAKEILKTHSVEIKAKEYMDFIFKVHNGEV